MHTGNTPGNNGRLLQNAQAKISGDDPVDPSGTNSSTAISRNPYSEVIGVPRNFLIRRENRE
jgi:hypothetical protein